eukprot:8733229-Alexandrium_andersonii.AAC.1
MAATGATALEARATSAVRLPAPGAPLAPWSSAPSRNGSGSPRLPRALRPTRPTEKLRTMSLASSSRPPRKRS